MNFKTKTQTKVNSGNQPVFTCASTGQNGQLIRIHPILHNPKVLLFQNKGNSPPGKESGSLQNQSKEIIQKIIK